MTLKDLTFKNGKYGDIGTANVGDIKADIIKTCRELEKSKEKGTYGIFSPNENIQAKKEALMEWCGITEDELK